MLCLLPLAAASCGGNEEPEPTSETTSETTASISQYETDSGVPESLENEPVEINFARQAVPPDFRATYERGTPIVVQFYEQGGQSFYPQGLGVDSIVDESMNELREQYPDVEFFSYDIDASGSADNSADLEPGQYGTLATQLGVGLTPYVAMLAPRDDGYVYESVFEGYVTQPVIEQSLTDLANTQTTGSDEEAQIVLEQVETVSEGGALRSITVGNDGEEPVDLGGYEISAVETSTGEASPNSESLTIEDEPTVEPGESLSLGRSEDTDDTEGNQVDATFGGGTLRLEPGDRVALVTPDGAVTATFTL